MEIDFLGLSSKHSTQNKKDQQNSKDSFTDSGEEISLSLCTSSSLDCQKDTLDFPENTWKFHGEQTIPACSISSNSTFCSLAFHSQENAPVREQSFVGSSRPFLHPSSTTSTLYDLNNRNLSELSTSPAKLTSFYSRCANVSPDTLLEKAENTMFTAGTSSTRPSYAAFQSPKGGYTPTVAMARKATLARFLEKRSHRLTKARKSFLMGEFLDTTNLKAATGIQNVGTRKRNVVAGNNAISNTQEGSILFATRFF